MTKIVTMLVQNLATLYNTNFVEEHGRTFYEEMNSYETFEEDYKEIAYRQKHFEREALKKANKLLFLDTEAIVTHRFLMTYHNKHSELLTEIAKEQKYDLWLFLEPDVEWVDDGTRNLGEQKIRNDGNRLLKAMLKVHGINCIEIKGNYNERLKEAIKHVEKLIN